MRVNQRLQPSRPAKAGHSMRRKAILGMLAFLVCVPIAFVLILWLTAPKHRINLASYGKILAGMTLSQLEAIFGVPPGHYVPGKPPYFFYILPDFTRYKFIRDRLNNSSEIGPAETRIETWSASDVAIT